MKGGRRRVESESGNPEFVASLSDSLARFGE